MTKTPPDDQFAAHQAVVAAPAEEMRSIRVMYGADYRTANPYQDMLYTAIGPVVRAEPASPEEALSRLDAASGRVVYHLHWEDHPTKQSDPSLAAEEVQRLLDGLDALSAAGIRILWTRHNLRPHSGDLHGLHAKMTPHLHKIADLIHVHSWQAVAAILAEERLEVAKTVVIPHCSYVGHYAEWPASDARAALGVPEEAHVFLLYGRLEEYKRVAETCEAFSEIDVPAARLVLAGVDVAGVRGVVGEDPRIILHDQFVKEDEVGKFFAAADTVLLPYRSSLTSGTAILAQGFARGVLGSDTPGIRDAVTDGHTGRVFPIAGRADIQTAMQTALAEGRDTWASYGRAGAATMRARDWEGLAAHWRRVFCELAGMPRSGDARGGWLDRM